MLPGAPLLEPFHARLRTPFAVLGVRTAGSVLAEITYLPRDAATLDPVNRLAALVQLTFGRFPAVLSGRSLSEGLADDQLPGQHAVAWLAGERGGVRYVSHSGSAGE